jgi:hypothetical protein
VPLLQDLRDNKNSLLGLKSLNQLIENESSHEHLIGLGKAAKIQQNQNFNKMLQKATQPKEGQDKKANQQAPDKKTQEINMMEMSTIIAKKQNPVRILVNIIMKTDRDAIMIEATKAIKNLSRTEDVITMLMSGDLKILDIVKKKFPNVDV